MPSGTTSEKSNKNIQRNLQKKKKKKKEFDPKMTRSPVLVII